MSDLIRREDAIKAVAEYISCDYPTDSMAEEDAKDLINTIPSADRPQGEWIGMYRNGFGNMIYMCSKCNFQAKRSNFCPNCGCRMKGVDDG